MSHIAAADIGGTHIRVVLNETNTKPIAHQRRHGHWGTCADEYCMIQNHPRAVGKQDINSLPSARYALWAATKWWTADRLTTG